MPVIEISKAPSNEMRMPPPMAKTTRAVLHGLEQDVVMGTFTHRDTYLPRLKASVKKFYPKIPFATVKKKQGIKQNFAALRKMFMETDKRFWLFLDDDIYFLNNQTIWTALVCMVNYGLGMVGVYSTYDKNYKLTDSLKFQETGWIPGYFQLVDSKKVGHIEPDMNLPDKNTAIDTSYSIAIKAEGYAMGLAPAVVYHEFKQVWMDQKAADKTNAYLLKKWGDFYFKNVVGIPNIVGDVPEIPNVPAAPKKKRKKATSTKTKSNSSTGKMRGTPGKKKKRR